MTETSSTETPVRWPTLELVVASKAVGAKATLERAHAHVREYLTAATPLSAQLVRDLPGDELSADLWERTRHYVVTGVDAGLDRGGLAPVSPCPQTADQVQAVKNLLHAVAAPVLDPEEIRPVAQAFRSCEIEAYEVWAEECRKLIASAARWAETGQGPGEPAPGADA
ncbi:hypothetical protein ACWCYY_11625 [Kitasatospora sp. NPDC001664]